jgi:hypothetical protein
MMSFTRSILTIAFSALVLSVTYCPCAFGATVEFANEENFAVHDSKEPEYKSELLRAVFVSVPNGVKIVSLYADSPLRSRLRTGDIITRLGGVKIDSFRELERHANLTRCDFIDPFRKNTSYTTMIQLPYKPRVPYGGRPLEWIREQKTTPEIQRNDK